MNRLTFASLAAVAASCATVAPIPNIKKPSAVEDTQVQSRDDLLKQLGTTHEGFQDNGDFIYCQHDILVKSARTAIINVCDSVLNGNNQDDFNCNLSDSSGSILNIKKHGDRNYHLWSITALCNPDHAVKTTCTATFDIEFAYENRKNSPDYGNGCARIKILDGVSINHPLPTPQTPRPLAPESN